MSWHIEVCGTKEAVTKVITTNTSIATPVQRMILEQVSGMTTDSPYTGDDNLYAIYVKTSGHTDKDMANINCIEVRRVVTDKKPKTE